MKEQNHPNVIKIRNAHVHNLKHIDVDIPLNKIAGIAGVSGSGKSSLALGVLYAEGSRRYPDALSTYTRRRMTQAPRAQVDEVLHIPAALALHQRPGAGNPKYVWNRIGAAEYVTIDVFKTGESLLSQWSLSGTHT